MHGLNSYGPDVKAANQDDRHGCTVFLKDTKKLTDWICNMANFATVPILKFNNKITECYQCICNW